MRAFRLEDSNSHVMHKLTDLMEQGHSVPPHKVRREAFHGRWGTNCFG